MIAGETGGGLWYVAFMSDVPDNLVLVLLRRMDAKLDRVIDDIGDLKHRMTSVERQVGELRVDMAGLSARMDRFDSRLDRIGRRLDLVDANPR